jgi:hypothetical protein
MIGSMIAVRILAALLGWIQGDPNDHTPLEHKLRERQFEDLRRLFNEQHEAFMRELEERGRPPNKPLRQFFTERLQKAREDLAEMQKALKVLEAIEMPTESDIRVIEYVKGLIRYDQLDISHLEAKLEKLPLPLAPPPRPKS